MKREYPDSKSDLFAAFIERVITMVSPRGYMAQVTMQSWMFLSSYEKLRLELQRRAAIVAMLHMDNMVMRIAFGTSATVWEVGGDSWKTGKYTWVQLDDLDGDAPRLFPAQNARNKTADVDGCFTVTQSEISAIPGSPIVYWLSEKMHSTFKSGKPLGDIAEPRRGLDTGDNSQFVRLWWEVSVSRSVRTCANRDVAERSGSRWFPFNKGGDYRKWWGNQELVVNWEQDGARIRDASKVPGARPQNLRFYFRPTLSWSRVTGGEPSFRFYPTGSIFSSNGPALYAENGDTCRPQDAGVLNSNTAKTLLQAIAPTMDFQTGQIAQIHVPEHENRRLANIVRSLTHTACEDWNASETSWDFRVDRLILLGRGGDC